MKQVIRLAIAPLLWISGLAAGFGALMTYETTPGGLGSALQTWPAESRIQRDSGRHHLLLFAHPHCPCTRASLDELARMLTWYPGQCAVDVLFVVPGGATDWNDTNVVRHAASLSGVHVSTDVNGVEASRFGAETSGHTLLFDRAGALLFSGGITARRGESGWSDGLETLTLLLKSEGPTGSRASYRETPVFGCPLFNPKESSKKGCESCSP